MPEGFLSRHLVEGLAPGTVVRLAPPRGEFVMPDPPPPAVLFLTAGSGITPVMAMLRALDRRREIPDVVHIHSARTAAEAIFAGDLAGLNDRYDSYQYSLRETSTAGRLLPEHLDEACPDWRERETYACGPGAMLDALREHFADATDHGGHDGDGRARRYLEWTWDPDPADSSYVVDYAYLLREDGRPPRVIHDRHVHGLFDRATWLRLLGEAGFVDPAVRPLEHSEVEPGSVEVFVVRRP